MLSTVFTEKNNSLNSYVKSFIILGENAKYSIYSYYADFVNVKKSHLPTIAETCWNFSI